MKASWKCLAVVVSLWAACALGLGAALRILLILSGIWCRAVTVTSRTPVSHLSMDAGCSPQEVALARDEDHLF